MFSDCSLSRLVLKPINGHKNTLVSRLQTSLRMCLTWCLLFSCYSLGISLLIFGCAHCSSCWLSSEEVYSKRNPFRTALTSPPLYICAWTRTSDNSSVHEIEPPSFLPLQEKEVGIFRAQFFSPGFFHLCYDTMNCAQKMPASVFWPNMDSRNVPIFARKIPGSHAGVLVHAYILGLEVLKAVIIYLSALIKVRQSLTAEAMRLLISSIMKSLILTLCGKLPPSYCTEVPNHVFCWRMNLS